MIFLLCCYRLFKNAFKIRGTPEASVKRFASSGATRRLLGMAGQGRMSSPDLRALNSSSCSANNQNRECSAIFSADAENSTPQKVQFFFSLSLSRTFFSSPTYAPSQVLFSSCLHLNKHFFTIKNFRCFFFLYNSVKFSKVSNKHN